MQAASASSSPRASLPGAVLGLPGFCGAAPGPVSRSGILKVLPHFEAVPGEFLSLATKRVLIYISSPTPPPTAPLLSFRRYLLRACGGGDNTAVVLGGALGRADVAPGPRCSEPGGAGVR